MERWKWYTGGYGVTSVDISLLYEIPIERGVTIAYSVLMLCIFLRASSYYIFNPEEFNKYMRKE